MTQQGRLYDGKKIEIFLLVFILLFSFIIRIPFLYEPPERDEGGYAYAGQEVLRGAVLYKDVIEHKPPLISYIYATMFWFLGQTSFAIKLFSSIYAILTTLAVFLLSRYIFGNTAALWSAFFYGLFSSGPVIHGTAVHPELFFSLPLTLSVLAYVAALRSDERWFIASGFFATIAVLIKTTAIPIFLLLYCVLVVYKNPFKNILSFIKSALLLTIGPAVCAIILFAFFAYHGALGDFVFWNITYNLNLMQQGGRASGFWPRLLGRGMQVSSEHLLLWMLSVTTLLVLLFKRRDATTLLLSLWPVTSFIGISMTGLFWPHYFQQILPPLATLSGYAVVSLYNKEILKGGMKWAVFMLTPLFIWAGYSAVSNGYKYYLVYTPEEISRFKYGSDIFNDTLKVSEYIKARTAPDDYIFQWGWEPQIYLLANRRCPNKYPYMQVVAGDPDPVNAIRTMRNSILEKKTKYIIIQRGREEWPGYREVAWIASQYYTPETEIGGMVIFIKNGAW